MSDETAAVTKQSESRFALARAGESGSSAMDVIRDNLGGETLSPFDLERIKVPSGGSTTWMLPTLEGEEAAKHFDAVVLFHRVARGYWPDGGEMGTPPVCSADDFAKPRGTEADRMRSEGITPHCDRCPMSQFGSARKDGKEKAGQACKMVRHVFLVREGDILPKLLACPPASLKGAKQWILKLSGAGLRPTDMVTRFELTPDKDDSGNPYARVKLTPIARLGEAEAAAMRAAADALRPVFEAAAIEASDVEAPRGGGDGDDEI